jgi:two-component system, cell cycle sensor histidine kinase and response regulator CckA
VAITSGFIDETLNAQAAAAGARELIFKANSVEAFCEAVERLAHTVGPQTKSVASR